MNLPPLCTRNALGVAAALAFLAGAVPAGAAPAKQPCTISIGCEFQVTAFKAEMTVKWSWSVSNQANNSGWASEEGAGTFSETMKWHPLSHNGMKGDGIVIIHGNHVEGTIITPRVETYETHNSYKTAQHPPVNCTNHGKVGDGGSSLSLKSAGAASGTIAIGWDLGMEEGGGGPDCVPTIASLVGVAGETKLFTTHVAIGELKVAVVRLHGQGSAPVKLDRSSTAPGAPGFKSSGSVIWEAQITLKALPGN